MLFLQRYILTLPALDRAEAFGQHPNADIASQGEVGQALVCALCSLQLQHNGAAGVSLQDQQLLELVEDLLEQARLQQSTELVIKAFRELDKSQV